MLDSGKIKWKNRFFVYFYISYRLFISLEIFFTILLELKANNEKCIVLSVSCCCRNSVDCCPSWWQHLCIAHFRSVKDIFGILGSNSFTQIFIINLFATVFWWMFMKKIQFNFFFSSFKKCWHRYASSLGASVLCILQQQASNKKQQ